jgi:guanylate kinase
MGRLVILSGPSCVGKGPLCAALARLHPELFAGLKKVTLYNSRDPRPGETDGVDYHFSTVEQVEAMRAKEGFSVFEVRGDMQALDIGELEKTLSESGAFFEGNPFVGAALLEVDLPPSVERVSAFLSPLSADEIEYLTAPERKVSLPDLLRDIMRSKLLRRTTRHKGLLSLKDLENIERRAASAYEELKFAPRFDWVIPNHDGEDSENWDAFYFPVGDARKALLAFVDILEGRRPANAEKWDADMVP